MNSATGRACDAWIRYLCRRKSMCLLLFKRDLREYLALILFLSTDLTFYAICADSDSFGVGAIDPWSRQDRIYKRKLLSFSPC